MKQIITVLIFFSFFAACSTSEKFASREVYNDLVGQNEITVLKTIGSPTQVVHTREGGKVMVYEYTEKGMFLTPNQSNFKYNANTKSITYTSNVNKVTNDPQYTIHQKNVSVFKAYIDKNGKCYRVDGSLPQEYMETHYERFKHFK